MEIVRASTLQLLHKVPTKYIGGYVDVILLRSAGTSPESIVSYRSLMVPMQMNFKVTLVDKKLIRWSTRWQNVTRVARDRIVLSYWNAVLGLTSHDVVRR